MSTEIKGWRLTAHELIKAGLNSHQAEAVLDFTAEAELTRGRGWQLDGEPHRMEAEPGTLELYLTNDAERIACVQVDADGNLVEV